MAPQAPTLRLPPPPGVGETVFNPLSAMAPAVGRDVPTGRRCQSQQAHGPHKDVLIKQVLGHQCLSKQRERQLRILHAL